MLRKGDDIVPVCARHSDLPYIDAFETKVYGKFARDQMAAVLMGLVPGLDAMIQFAIAEQAKADQIMADLLDRQPKAPALDPETILSEARDVIVRFGAHLESLKGRPVDPKVFFRGEAPSLLARRRLTKLTAAMGHIVDEFENHKDKIRDQGHRKTELKNAFEDLSTVEKQQRASRVEKVVLVPEVAAGRDAWLVTYNANKNLVRGLLAYAGKPELLPLVFDDLAEIPRVSGVSDEPQNLRRPSSPEQSLLQTLQWLPRSSSHRFQRLNPAPRKPIGSLQTLQKDTRAHRALLQRLQCKLVGVESTVSIVAKLDLGSEKSVANVASK